MERQVLEDSLATWVHQADLGSPVCPGRWVAKDSPELLGCQEPRAPMDRGDRQGREDLLEAWECRVWREGRAPPELMDQMDPLDPPAGVDLQETEEFPVYQDPLDPLGLLASRDLRERGETLGNPARRDLSDLLACRDHLVLWASVARGERKDHPASRGRLAWEDGRETRDLQELPG